MSARMHIQRKKDAYHDAVPQLVHEALHSGGAPLDVETRAFMEPRFGQDFSNVRIHTDSTDARSAESVSALAYTVGSDIVFDVGQYQPGTDTGRRLIAHELAHVLQQSNGKVARFTLLQRSEEGREGLGENSDSEGGDAAVTGDIACSLMPDSWVIAAVRTYFLLFPRARKHLDHYLSGANGTYEEDVDALFKDNPKIAERIGRKIQEQGGQSGVLYGTGSQGDGNEPPIRSSEDYDSTDWRLSLGNVDKLSYEVLDDPDTTGVAPVNVSINDPYEWHPAEDRGTQCIHEVMERQKTEGKAKNFTSIGSATVRLKVGTTEQN